MQMRGTNAIISAFQLPVLCPGIGTKGEKAKEVTLGAMVERRTVITPKPAPKHTPAFHPKRMAARITGICVVVAFINGSGMEPSGVKPMRNIIAINIAIAHRRFVRFCFISGQIRPCS